MVIPKIKKSKRSREFNLYSEEERAEVVRAYLFKGMAHRQIDSQILQLDSSYTRGFQSMSLLHYLGLTDPFKGLFKDFDETGAIEKLKETGDTSYNAVIETLENSVISETMCASDIKIETAVEYPVTIEGQRQIVFTTKYERKPKLRKQAIQIHGTSCMACGFDFKKNYGDWGKGYIEVHHLKPLSTIAEEVEVNPETDLVVLCANCHRMIHRKQRKILSLEELKALIHS